MRKESMEREVNGIGKETSSRNKLSFCRDQWWGSWVSSGGRWGLSIPIAHTLHLCCFPIGRPQVFSSGVPPHPYLSLSLSVLEVSLEIPSSSEIPSSIVPSILISPWMAFLTSVTVFLTLVFLVLLSSWEFPSVWLNCCVFLHAVYLIH